MNKLKFLVPVLLLVALVLVGAWCGKEEPKEEKTGELEEEKENLPCPELTCYPGFTVGDSWEEPMADGASSINVICVATKEVDRDEILAFYEQEYTSMGWKKEPDQDHTLYLSSGKNLIIVSPPVPGLTLNYSLECLEYKVGPGEQEEEEEEREEEEEGSENFYREEFYRKYCEVHMKIQPELGHYGKGYTAQGGFYESFAECVEKNIEQEEIRYSECLKEDSKELCDYFMIPILRGEYMAHMAREHCQIYMWVICDEQYDGGEFINQCAELHVGACDALPVGVSLKDFQKYFPEGYL